MAARVMAPLLIVLAYVTLCIIRAPAVFAGRFWGEEGVYYAAFQSMGRVKSLFFSASGYPLFLTNVIVRFAEHVPTVYAPLVTTYVSFSVEIALIFLMLAWRKDIGLDLISIGLIALGLAVMPQSAEVLASTTNLQWWCAAIAVVILIDNGQRNFIFSCAVLFCCALSGVAPALLLPAFAFKVFIDRSRAASAQFLALGTGSLIVVITGLLVGARVGASRTFPLDAMVYLRAISIQDFFSLFFGAHTATPMAQWYGTAGIAGLIVSIICIVAIAALFVIGSIREHSRRVALLLAAAFLVSVVVGIFGGIQPERFMEGGWRYFFVPNFILLLMLATVASTFPCPRIGASSLVTLIFVNLWPSPWLSVTSQGPAWKDELAKGTPQIGIWPSGWTITLLRR